MFSIKQVNCIFFVLAISIGIMSDISADEKKINPEYLLDMSNIFYVGGKSIKIKDICDYTKLDFLFLKPFINTSIYSGYDFEQNRIFSTYKKLVGMENVLYEKESADPYHASYIGNNDIIYFISSSEYGSKMISKISILSKKAPILNYNLHIGMSKKQIENQLGKWNYILNDWIAFVFPDQRYIAFQFFNGVVCRIDFFQPIGNFE